MLEGKWAKILQSGEYHGPEEKKRDNNFTDIYINKRTMMVLYRSPEQTDLHT